MPSFLSALLFILPAIVSAQEPIQRDDAAVEKVASEGFRAVQASKWNQFVELMHPDALREVKGLIAPALEAAAKDEVVVVRHGGSSCVVVVRSHEGDVLGSGFSTFIQGRSRETVQARGSRASQASTRAVSRSESSPSR